MDMFLGNWARSFEDNLNELKPKEHMSQHEVDLLYARFQMLCCHHGVMGYKISEMEQQLKRFVPKSQDVVS